MKKELALTIKLVITSILAIAGIAYILKTPPVSSIEGYQKQKMATPLKKQARPEATITTKDMPTRTDHSLTGKEGKFDNTRIGKQVE
ncbi:MAG: hypothetical protein OEY43_01920 [Gammaproteobacteria bacterium]|nr:hypothetical protein [Gammaproteobacteria bacterium]